MRETTLTRRTGWPHATSVPPAITGHGSQPCRIGVPAPPMVQAMPVSAPIGRLQNQQHPAFAQGEDHREPARIANGGHDLLMKAIATLSPTAARQALLRPGAPAAVAADPRATAPVGFPSARARSSGRAEAASPSASSTAARQEAACTSSAVQPNLSAMSFSSAAASRAASTSPAAMGSSVHPARTFERRTTSPVSVSKRRAAAAAASVRPCASRKQRETRLRFAAVAAGLLVGGFGVLAPDPVHLA